MNGRSIALVLAVFGSPALFACGGKATGGTSIPDGNPSEPTPPPGVYDPPPPTYDTPPPTMDTPPPIYDPPVAGGGQACIQLCNFAAANTCQGVTPTPEEIAACPAGCQELLVEFAPCEEQFGAALSCILTSPFFEDFFTAICNGEEPELDEEEILAVCEGPIMALEECSGSITEPDPDPDPDPDVCSEADQCVGCVDNCESCECALGADSETCIEICQLAD